MLFESYMRLPRHPSYKFEYWDSQLRISPRWRSHRFFLELQPPEECPRIDELSEAAIRPLAAGDWEMLPEVLAAAFRDSPPLGMLGDRRRVWAARDWLRSTREGGEGPLLEPACVVAVDREDESIVLGALLVTLIVDRERSVVARTLWIAGHRELASATHCGNDASLAWHWRNGFRLLPHHDSVRLIKPKDRDQPGP
jgi:hypothetical protein